MRRNVPPANLVTAAQIRAAKEKGLVARGTLLDSAIYQFLDSLRQRGYSQKEIASAIDHCLQESGRGRPAATNKLGAVWVQVEAQKRGSKLGTMANTDTAICKRLFGLKWRTALRTYSEAKRYAAHLEREKPAVWLTLGWQAQLDALLANRAGKSREK